MAPRTRVHRVGTLNAHNDPTAVRRFLRYGCDSYTLNEVNQLTRLLNRRRGYRTWWVDAGHDRRRGENQVVVRSRFDTLGVIDLRASEQARPARIAPDRYLRVNAFAGPLGPTAHVAIHPNFVGRADTRPHAPRIREYDEWSATLDRVLTLLHGEGFHAIVAGDGNTHQGRRSPGWDDVYDVLHAHSMTVRSTGLDLVAWPEQLRLWHAPEIVRRRELGRRVDHDALIVTLTHA